MPRNGSKPVHVSRGNVFGDLGFSPEEAAVLRKETQLRMKTQLHIEIMRAIEKQKLTPRQLEKVLDVPQPRVSELTSGKISRMTADLLAKYLYRLGGGRDENQDEPAAQGGGRVTRTDGLRRKLPAMAIVRQHSDYQT